ncbi:SET domain-containing protein-lysine N-methyltransferase, partial [Alcanivorax sp. HI0013]
MPKPYLRDDLLEVRRSAVHGRGLFASLPIKKGTELGLCKTKPAKKDGPYVLSLDDEGNERYRVLCDLRFINHGKKPN